MRMPDCTFATPRPPRIDGDDGRGGHGAVHGDDLEQPAGAGGSARRPVDARHGRGSGGGPGRLPGPGLARCRLLGRARPAGRHPAPAAQPRAGRGPAALGPAQRPGDRRALRGRPGRLLPRRRTRWPPPGGDRPARRLVPRGRRPRRPRSPRAAAARPARRIRQRPAPAAGAQPPPTAGSSPRPGTRSSPRTSAPTRSSRSRSTPPAARWVPRGWCIGPGPAPGPGTWCAPAGRCTC